MKNPTAVDTSNEASIEQAARGEPSAPVFDTEFQAKLLRLIEWRRDVRRFRRDPVKPELIGELLDVAQFAPSVGNSQPWRWVNIESRDLREQVRRNFATCNAEALARLHGERAELYARLKLHGLDAAPWQFAVFCDQDTEQGGGLGRQTMPEVLGYSVAGMISTFWLAARAFGLGVGWVSILEPEQMTAMLQVPASWKFVAYLCVGWPEEEHDDPELARHGWQQRTPEGRNVVSR